MEVIEQSHEILYPRNLKENEYNIYRVLELAGRIAYKSEDIITDESSIRFINNIIKRGHESVLEHYNIQVKFITDRGVTHELVRHRLCAYTQESTRYCNYSKKGMTFIKPVFWINNDTAFSRWLEHMLISELDYNYLISINATPQEARTVLPNSLKTEIVCTANIREWRHVLKLRTSKAAHPQMQALMIPLLKELQEKLPVLFNDIVTES